MAAASSSSHRPGQGTHSPDDESKSHSSEIPVQPRPRLHVKRKRSVKDPNAPVRPHSAYLCFLLEKQDEFRKADPERQVVAEITRRVGAAWQKLSQDDRQVYEAKAEESKARYTKEMAEYEGSELQRQFLAQKKNQDSESPEEPVKRRRKKAGNATPVSLHLDVRSSGVGSGGRRAGREGTLLCRQILPEISKSCGSLTELRVPILTKEFMDWNTRREKDLRQVRHLAHELEIDVAGLRTHNEQGDKMVDTTAVSRKNLEALLAAKKEVVKILVANFAGIRLPSGLVISAENAEEYMAEMEKATSKSPARHADMMAKIRQVAPKLQPFMAHLQ